MVLLYIVLYSLKNKTSWVETPLHIEFFKKEKRRERKEEGKDKVFFTELVPQWSSGPVSRKVLVAAVELSTTEVLTMSWRGKGAALPKLWQEPLCTLPPSHSQRNVKFCEKLGKRKLCPLVGVGKAIICCKSFCIFSILFIDILSAQNSFSMILNIQ